MEFSNEFVYAQKVIKEAGKLLLSRYYDNNQISFKTDKSWVTTVDHEIENFIRNRLEYEFPHYGFIGEEGIELKKDIAWIIDPLDGTIAFVRHLPDFGIALAFKKERQVIFSVQYIPLTNLLLTAYKGQGAYSNGKRLHIKEREGAYQTLLSIKAQMFWWTEFKDYTVNLVKPNRFRVGDSSVVESYYLASNKTDVFIRFKQPIWDTAAECLLMEEAGACITDEYNNPLQLEFSKTALFNIIATHPSINKKLAHLLFMKNS